ncbi:MAG: prenyltransferase [Theionarchaea archaeon]|nr:prenyltransferase [Theionarchaea archaeon]
MSGRSLAWVDAMRWQYYPTTFLVLLVGVSVSVYEGLDSYVVVLWMVLGNFLLHCSCSLINEYTDFVTGADLVEYPEMGWKATGGSKVLVDQLVKPRNVLVVSLLLFFGSVCIWVVLGAKLGYVLVLMLVISLGVTFLYSAAVSKGGFFYVREILLTFGAVPLLVVAVVKILSGRYSVTALTAGLIVGMQMMNYLLYHGLIDLEADFESGKLRLTRVLGLERTLLISEVLVVGTFVILAVLLWFNVFPLGCVLCFVLVPLAVKIVHAEMKKVNLLRTYTEVMLLFVVSALLLSIGFWL